MLVYLAMIDDPSDIEKFEDLYYRYRPFLIYVANEILHNDQDAEDAAHEAFISIARNMQKIGDITSPQTVSFVRIIAERKAINIYNKRKKLAVDELHEEITGVVDDNLGGDALETAIKRLPARYREFLTLKYKLGYSTKECAEILELSLATASKLDQRAKNKLEEICREEGIL